LRAEGVLEVGSVKGAAIVFVRTNAKLRLFHAGLLEEELQSRPLDKYAIDLAVAWIESGHTATSVAQNLGVSHSNLAQSLRDAGYVRMSAVDNGLRAGANARNFGEKVVDGVRQRGGNRGSRLVKVGESKFRFARNDS